MAVDRRNVTLGGVRGQVLLDEGFDLLRESLTVASSDEVEMEMGSAIAFLLAPLRDGHSGKCQRRAESRLARQTRLMHIIHHCYR